MQLKLRFCLRTLLLVPAAVSVVLAAVWWWPKSQPLSLNDQIYLGYYRGLGWTSDTSFYGKRFYLLLARDDPYGYLEVDYRSPGYNTYRGYYSNGVCREEGECYVEINGGAEDPAPDNNNIKWGLYYKPDGSLGSEVRRGTGTQVYWYPDGSKRWELILNNYSRIRHSLWYENGQLHTTQNYEQGELEGKFVSFHKNGQVQLEGEYSSGDRVGRWIRYDEVGNIASIEDYSNSSSEGTP